MPLQDILMGQQKHKLAYGTGFWGREERDVYLLKMKETLTPPEFQFSRMKQPYVPTTIMGKTLKSLNTFHLFILETLSLTLRKAAALSTDQVCDDDKPRKP